MIEATGLKRIISKTGAASSGDTYWFPGRWLGGTSLVFGPLLLLAGVLLRIQFHFFFPQQLTAFRDHPTLIGCSYSCFLAGNILMWPAIVTLTRLIGSSHPRWATWGGSLVIFGLFARTFHAGVDHLAFQLVRINGLDSATRTVANSYGAFHVVSGLTVCILAGWIVLAIGAYVSHTLGVVRAISLGLMSALMIGVLKGSSFTSVIATSGFCIALVPLGITVLRMEPKPGWRQFADWFAFIALLAAVMFYIGQQG
jgi:hypothetical protein